MKNIKWKSTNFYLLLAVVLACGSPAFAVTQPVITSQPSDATLDYGQSTNLSITATGTNLTYQWYEGISGDTANSTKLSGKTSSSYTTPTDLNQDVFYWVRVSNSAGHTDSAAATVALNDSQPTITLQPAITLSGRALQMQTIGTQPAVVSIDYDDSDSMRVYVRLRVDAAGPNLSYQWYQGLSGDTSTPITNATSSINTEGETYTLLNTPPMTESTSFWARASNSTYHVDSAAATITVTDNKLSETVGALRLLRPSLLQYVPVYVEGWYQFYEAEYNNPDDSSLGINYVQPFEASPKVGRYGEDKVVTATFWDPDSGLYSKSRRYKGANGGREQYLRMVLTSGVYIENDAPFPIMGFTYQNPVADYMGFINIEDGDAIATNSDSLVIVDCWDERANIREPVDDTKPSNDADGVQWVQLIINKGLPSEATINCTRRQDSMSFTTPPVDDLWGLFHGVLNLPEGAYSLNIRYESNDPVYNSNGFYTYTPTGIITDGPRITITTGNAAVPPSIPTGFVATPGDGYVRLSWAHDDSQVVASYKVYRALSPSGGSYSLLGTVSPNSSGPGGLNEYVDNSAVDSNAYAYVVKAVDSSGVESFFSDEVTVTAGAPVGGTDRTLLFNYTFNGGKALNWHFTDLDSPSRTTYYGETAASGTVGALTSNHYFSIAVSALDNWDATGAQSEIDGGTFSTFLTRLEETSQGFVKAASGSIGVDDEDVEKDANGIPIESVKPKGYPEWIVLPDDSYNELDGTNEAVVFTVDTTGLGSGLALQLKEIKLDRNTTADFLIYDVSENMLIQKDFNTATSGQAFTGTWSLEPGDKIIVGASGGAFFCCDNFTFKIVTGAAPTNDAPVWDSDPVNKKYATQNVEYHATLVDDATDANSDSLTFSKVAGPTWLTVTTNGVLSGTPLAGDIGNNSWTVCVSDGSAPAVDAELNITVYSNIWTDLLFDDFEAGWGNWVDGGGSASLSTNTNCVVETQGVDLESNAGDASSTWLVNPLDLSGYTDLKIEFTYMPVAFENGEGFRLQFSENGGTTWTNIQTFIVNTDFINDERQSPVVDINSSNYNFTTNVNIRFECVASGGAGDVYIDDVRILSARDGFTIWAINKGLTGDDFLPGANPDGDKLNNLSEWYIGSDPKTADSSGSILNGINITAMSSFEYTHDRPVDRSNVLEIYQWSTDLNRWNDSGETANGTTVTITPDADDPDLNPDADYESVTVQAAISGTVPDVLFSRLVISKP